MRGCLVQFYTCDHLWISWACFFSFRKAFWGLFGLVVQSTNPEIFFNCAILWWPLWQNVTIDVYIYAFLHKIIHFPMMQIMWGQDPHLGYQSERRWDRYIGTPARPCPPLCSIYLLHKYRTTNKLNKLIPISRKNGGHNNKTRPSLLRPLQHRRMETTKPHTPPPPTTRIACWNRRVGNMSDGSAFRGRREWVWGSLSPDYGAWRYFPPLFLPGSSGQKLISKR